MFKRKLTNDEVTLVRDAGDEYQRLKSEARLLCPAALAEKMELSESSIRDILCFRTYKRVGR